jgi:Fe2+ or Zn2+ uptake regulation protein
VPRISLATVYKALEALVSTGIASKLSGGVGGEPSARYDARLDRHYHFYCARTGKVHDLPTEFDAGLIEKLDPKLSEHLDCHGFHVTGYHLVLLGYQEPTAIGDRQFAASAAIPHSEEPTDPATSPTGSAPTI